MAVGAIIGGAVIKGIGARKEKKANEAAADAQYGLDQENRALSKLELEESIKRTEYSNRQTEGNAASQIGASGFGSGSSMDAYMSTIKSAHSSDVDWMKTSGASRDAISAREASARKRSSDSQAKAGFIKGIGGAIGGLGGLW